VFSLVEIFTKPGKVFDRVRLQQIWLAPFFAAVVLLTLPTVLVIYTAGIELLTLQRYQHNPKLMAAIGGEDGVERAVGSSNDRWTKLLVVSRVAGAAAAGIVIFSVALILVIGFLDQRPNFFATLGTVSYSVLPFALFGALISAVLLAMNADHSALDLENMPGLNLSNLLDRESSQPAIFAIAAGLDVLAIGEILLLSFGLTKLSRLHYIQAFAICCGLWTLAVLWKAAITVYL
jgi:Yip1 domain